MQNKKKSNLLNEIVGIILLLKGSFREFVFLTRLKFSLLRKMSIECL